MFEKKTIVTALGGVLVGGMLLTGGMAIAGDAKDLAVDGIAGKPFFGKFMKHGGGMEPGRGHFTQEQKQQQLSDSLKGLVEKGTLSQAQADKIMKGFKDAETERKALLAKMENMTLKEIRQYMKDNRGKHQSAISKMLADGTITREQAKAIRQAMRETAQKQKQQQITSGLKALVEKGTITQAQADKIMAKIESQKRQGPLSQLVTDGTITQDQAKAVGELLGRGGPEGRFHGRK